MKWISMTRKTDGDVICIGPFVGGWAYFFFCYLPFVKRIREEHPDAILVASGYLSDWWYLLKYCDYYVGFDIDMSATRTIGRNETVNDPTTADIVKMTTERLSLPTKVYNMDGDDAAHNHIYRTFNRDVEKIHCAHDHKSNTIAVWGRRKPGGRVSNNGSSEHWDRTVEYLISKGFDVKVFGTKTGNYRPTNDEAQDLTGYTEMERAQKTAGEMAKCLCSLHDCSSSANYSQFVGNPTLIFNCNPRDEVLFQRRNLFGTMTAFCNPKSWGDGELSWKGPNPMIDVPYDDYASMWEKSIDVFIEHSRTRAPYATAVASTDTVLNRK